MIDYNKSNNLVNVSQRKTQTLSMQRQTSQGSVSLPCLNSNISNETILKPTSKPQNLSPKFFEKSFITSLDSQVLDPKSLESKCSDSPELINSAIPKLSTQHKKTAFILKESVAHLADTYGLPRIGFLTLTFAQHITDPKVAQKRLNSLLTGVIKERYKEYLGVFERQKSGRIHYHLLIVLDQDIRTGFNFSDISKGNYTSASSGLRMEWAYWRKTAKKYGFGRTELLPVKSNIEAMSKYVGKYISKHVDHRNDEDKGVRLVRYSKGARIGTTRFQFNTTGSAEWRRKLRTFAEIVKQRHPDEEIDGLSDLTRILGPRWAYTQRDFILSIP